MLVNGQGLVVMKRKKTTEGRYSMIVILTALGVIFMVELLVYAWCRVQYVRTGYELTEASEEYRRLVGLNRKLKVEEARLKSPERIVRIAKERGLVIPNSEQVVVVP